jgi:hypothetical protein
MSTDNDATTGERSGNRPEGHEQFTVADMANENARFFDSKGEADDGMEKAENAPGVEPELFPPGNSPEFLYHGDDDPTQEVATEPTEAEVMEVSDPDPEPQTTTAEAAQHDLPERSVSDDPLTWMPGDFIDTIDGSQAINRRGFEVLSHFYDISVASDLEVPPEDTDHEYCRVNATAETPDGRTCEAYGSAHVERDDDMELLLEMADTRARKRALSIATGVGAVAVSELKSEAKAELEASD